MGRPVTLTWQLTRTGSYESRDLSDEEVIAYEVDRPSLLIGQDSRIVGHADLTKSSGWHIGPCGHGMVRAFPYLSPESDPETHYFYCVLLGPAAACRSTWVAPEVPWPSSAWWPCP